MISSAPHSRIASCVAMYGSGSITSPCAGMPSSRRRSSVSSRRTRAAERTRVVVDHEALPRRVLRADDGAADRPACRALLDRLEQLVPADRLVGDDQHVGGLLRRLGGVGRLHRYSRRLSVPPWPLPLPLPFAACAACPSPDSAADRDLLAVAVQHSVHGPGHPVLVRSADDLRDLVEVEDRRRRGDLPLERARAPRVAGRARVRTPSCDEVVEEHQRRGAQQERADRGHEVPGRELVRVVGDAARHALEPEPVHRARTSR